MNNRLKLTPEEITIILCVICFKKLPNRKHHNPGYILRTYPDIKPSFNYDPIKFINSKPYHMKQAKAYFDYWHIDFDNESWDQIEKINIKEVLDV